MLRATKRSPGPTTRGVGLDPGDRPRAAARWRVEPAECERDDLVPFDRYVRRGAFTARSGQRPTPREPRLAQRLARDVPIVERHDDARGLLALLVTLARDHDDVAGAGSATAPMIADAPVRVDLDVHPGPLEHVLDDRERFLAPRVVGRDDDVIGAAAQPRRPSAAACPGRGRHRRRRRRSAGRRRGRAPPAARCRASPAYARSRRSPRTAAPRRPPRTVPAHPASRASPPRSSSSMSSRMPAAIAPRTFSTLKRPRSGVSISIPAARKRLPDSAHLSPSGRISAASVSPNVTSGARRDSASSSASLRPCSSPTLTAAGGGWAPVNSRRFAW